MSARYEMARKRSGLSLGQAEKAAGFSVAPIEETGTATPEQHAALAKLYEVTSCWLSGHGTTPDLRDLRKQAAQKGVSFADWAEISTFAQAMSTCPPCATQPKEPTP